MSEVSIDNPIISLYQPEQHSLNLFVFVVEPRRTQSCFTRLMGNLREYLGQVRTSRLLQAATVVQIAAIAYHATNYF